MPEVSFDCSSLVGIRRLLEWLLDNTPSTDIEYKLSRLCIKQAAYAGSDRVVVYGLREVGGHDIRYIGQTVNLSRRISTHNRDLRRKSRKAEWIRETKDRGSKVEAVVIEPHAVPDWAEMYHILRFRFANIDLLNSTEGGAGHFTEEVREKISAAGRGRHPSVETRAKIGAAGRGRRHTEEYKKRMSVLFWSKHTT